MVTKKDIETLNEIRKLRRQYEAMDKELTAKILSSAGDETGKTWKNISYEIVDGKNTTANKTEIMKLPEWEKYYKTTTYKKINIKA